MARKRRLAQMRPDPLPDTLLGSLPARTLDLHGITAAQAEPRLRDFLTTCTRVGRGQVVRVITGKGKGSPDGPVLEPLVRRLLAGSLAPYVAAYTAEPGGGSYLVRVK